MNLDEIRQLVFQGKNFRFPRTHAGICIFGLGMFLLLAIVFLIGNAASGGSMSYIPGGIFFLIFSVLLLYEIISTRAILSISREGIQIEGGFAPVNIQFQQIDSVEYYIEHSNGMESDYYAQFILKTGQKKKISIKYWKVWPGMKAEVCLRTIIETYYAVSK